MNPVHGVLAPVAEAGEEPVSPGGSDIAPGIPLIGPRGRAPRRWTLNGDFLGLSPNGVARYARETVVALDQLVRDGHPLTRGLRIDLVAPRPPPDGFTLEAIPIRVVEEFRRPRLPQVWVQIQLPGHVPGGLVSFCNLAPVRVARQILCIHDMHTRLMPESYPAGFRLAHRVLLPILGRRAARVTTVSELSRDHLARFGIAPPDKVVVTYNGSDHALRWAEAPVPFVNPTGRPFVLGLGRRQPYKNLGLLVRLAERLRTLGIDVLLAGEVDERDILGHADPVPDNIRCLGRVSDATFGAALSAALCFVFPSRIEGFGLPAVEAMVRGCPVLASTAPCLPEICGDAALYAGPDDVEGWAANVLRLSADPARRARLIDAGRTRARRYTWRRIAEQYLELMRDVDEEAA
jgi:glycosyltransferase involved in cell wall biosynthesis